MSKSVLTLLLMVGIATIGKAQEPSVHFKSVLIDTHNDVMASALMQGLHLEDDLSGKAHTDMDRMKQGGVDAQFFSIWCGDEYTDGGGFALANQQIDTLMETIRRNPAEMTLVRTYDELQRAIEQGKLAALIGVEGGHMIENNLNCLDSLFARGARYLTLTWNNSTPWATSAEDETLHDRELQHVGLSDFGEKVIRHMNKIGMMVDLSHVGEKTFWDAMEIVEKPVLISHSSVYAICPHYRNLKDEQIKAVAENGGVICVNFYSGYIDPAYNTKMKALAEKYPEEADSLRGIYKSEYTIGTRLLRMHPEMRKSLRAPFSLLIDHIDYIAKLVGVDYVGIGSDFDGVNSLPQRLNSVADYPKITKELIKRGYSDEDIAKILGENVMRVFKANCE